MLLCYRRSWSRRHIVVGYRYQIRRYKISGEAAGANLVQTRAVDKFIVGWRSQKILQVSRVLNWIVGRGCLHRLLGFLQVFLQKIFGAGDVKNGRTFGYFDGYDRHQYWSRSIEGQRRKYVSDGQQRWRFGVLWSSTYWSVIRSLLGKVKMDAVTFLNYYIHW